MSTAATWNAQTAPDERSQEILSPEALDFVAELHSRFEPTRQELLGARRERAAELQGGGTLDFLEETREIREGDWQVAPPCESYLDRRVEITGPTDRKLVINALNSGAKGFMADFEDSTAPTWENVVVGHVNLIDAIDRTIPYDASDGKYNAVAGGSATLLVRPRGWHLDEKHVRVGDTPVSGGLLDFGLYFVHNEKRLLDAGSRVYLFLPKMEDHLEARRWGRGFGFP